jgi:hypothetical protein
VFKPFWFASVSSHSWIHTLRALPSHYFATFFVPSFACLSDVMSSCMECSGTLVAISCPAACCYRYVFMILNRLQNSSAFLLLFVILSAPGTFTYLEWPLQSRFGELNGTRVSRNVNLAPVRRVGGLEVLRPLSSVLSFPLPPVCPAPAQDTAGSSPHTGRWGFRRQEPGNLPF